MQDNKGHTTIINWLAGKGLQPFSYQQQVWRNYLHGKSGLVNAPTGYGKTFSVFLVALIEWINDHPRNWQSKKNNGLQLLWITPLRALAKDIARAMEEVISELNISWQVGIRSGDTTAADRARQKKQMPEILLITPESLHLLLAQKNYPGVFKNLRCIVADEWHELLGSKRGVQIELALSRLKSICQSYAENQQLSTTNYQLKIWGISATIGNLEEALEVLLGQENNHAVIVSANVPKQIIIESIFPDEIEKYPWAGHLGIKLLPKIIPIIEQSRTTLIFINTRGMAEIWYQQILNYCPELAGLIALHHGSIDMELRMWVEENLHTGKLKAVVCTSSLDLGVDFRPVDTVIQIGSPKGVARFLQRAGRSGHQPGAVSKIYFVPTHSLELVEAAALKEAAVLNDIEQRVPVILAFDVLLQYLTTLAVSDGFNADEIFAEIQSTFCYRNITIEEWQWILSFLTTGGEALQQYDEFKKIEREGNYYFVNNRRIAMRHRLHIGTIVSDAMLKVKFISGGYIGMIEESFISRLTPGDVFGLAGRILEFIMIKDMTVLARKSNSKKAIIPSWNGGRMPLSSNLAHLLRLQFDNIRQGDVTTPELQILIPLFDLQQQLSHIPGSDELLIENVITKDGHHLFVYPFEGRLVHEVMAALLAYRISCIAPITFSLAMNDYGFELLSDQPAPVNNENVKKLFSDENLDQDIQRSVNATEMARRKFRDIACISGLIFQGYPGNYKPNRHLQSSASLIFNVFKEYDAANLLLSQAFTEAFFYQMEEARLRGALQRIQQQKIIITKSGKLTPFSVPLKVDSMRESVSSEKLEDRIRKMKLQLE